MFVSPRLTEGTTNRTRPGHGCHHAHHAECLDETLAEATAADGHEASGVDAQCVILGVIQVYLLRFLRFLTLALSLHPSTL